MGKTRRSWWLAGLVPSVLIAVGLLHSVVGFWAGAETLRGIVRDGIWNTVHSEPGPPGRDTIRWFLLSGFLLVVLGHLGFWVERRLGRPLPLAFGLELLALSLLILVVSGGGLPAWILAAVSLDVVAVNVAGRRPRPDPG